MKPAEEKGVWKKLVKKFIKGKKVEKGDPEKDKKISKAKKRRNK